MKLFKTFLNACLLMALAWLGIVALAARAWDEAEHVIYVICAAGVVIVGFYLWAVKTGRGQGARDALSCAMLLFLGIAMPLGIVQSCREDARNSAFQRSEQDRRREETRRAALPPSEPILDGRFRVIQVIPGGVLVEGACTRQSGSMTRHSFDLAMVAGISGTTEGKTFEADVVPWGTFTYSSVLGASRTVVRYSLVRYR
jgi:hypothetical protein